MTSKRIAVGMAGALLLAAASGASAKHAAGPNLVVNASFEEGVIDAAGPVAAELPLLPVGWAVEGLTVLHDYTPKAFRTGKRAAIISGALGGGQKVCDHSNGLNCVDNPLHGPMKPVDDEALKRWSLRPFWVTAAAIAVKEGSTYRFSVWAQRPSLDPNAGVDGHGAATKIRWFGADGAVVAVSDGPAHLKDPKRRDIGWKLISADVVAPKGAVGAKLMLGHSDYSHTGAQVAFDDVAFQEVVRH